MFKIILGGLVVIILGLITIIYLNVKALPVCERPLEFIPLNEIIDCLNNK